MSYHKATNNPFLRPVIEGALAGNVTHEQVADLIASASGARHGAVLATLRSSYPTTQDLLNYIMTELLVIEKKDLDDLADKIKRGLVRLGAHD